MALQDLSLWEPSEEEIVAATAEEVRKAGKRHFYENIRGFSHPPVAGKSGLVWIKYGYDTERLRCEANTQAFVHGELESCEEKTRKEFRVPRVFDFFEAEIDGLPYGMIVMEFVEGVPISKLTAQLRQAEGLADKEKRIEVPKQRVADAICFLLSLQAPPDVVPGPVGGGRIVHFIFGRDEPEAPREFEDLEELQAYINTENKKSKPELARADFSHEELQLCYCDLNFDNFMLENSDSASGRLTIIDFEHCSWLPASFLIWEIWDKRDAYLDEHIRAQGHLKLNRANLFALDELRLQRAQAQRLSW